MECMVEGDGMGEQREEQRQEDVKERRERYEVKQKAPFRCRVEKHKFISIGNVLP